MCIIILSTESRMSETVGGSQSLAIVVPLIGGLSSELTHLPALAGLEEPRQRREHAAHQVELRGVVLLPAARVGPELAVRCHTH
eukprot:COSAG01_NODE_2533_length_7491_cov_236.560741_8_plen_84_part_00